MDSTYDLMEVLNHIDPSELSYQDWINVGMALQHEGYSVDVWDRWSMNDRRFHGAGTPVTGGTIVQYARDQGWTPPYDPGTALDWNDTISAEGIIVDKNWVEEREVTEPRQWDPAGELIKYLETLFEAGENVGYVVKSWKKDEKYLPADKGLWSDGGAAY